MSYDNPSFIERIAQNPVPWIVTGVAGLFLLFSTVSVVPETRQGVVLRLSKPDRIINGYHKGEIFGETGAGLIAKIPFFEEIIWIDKRILDIDMDPQQVLSTDQLRLNVDAYARFRIVDPLKMYTSARTSDSVATALRPDLGIGPSQRVGQAPICRFAEPGTRPGDG